MTDHQSLSERFAAIRYIGDMIPIAGRGAPVAPATYIGEKEGVPKFAYSPQQRIPDPATKYSTFLKDEHGVDVLRPSVALNSLGGEATRIESGIYEGQADLGVTLPGIYVNARGISDDGLERIAEQALKGEKSPYTRDTLAEALRFDLEAAETSSWTSPHRHADTYVRHAVIDDKQIWSDPSSEFFSIISRASEKRADLLFRYFPNSALLGFWLASVAPRRHNLARSLSSVVTGYDAHEVFYGATKGDPLGGIAKSSGVRRNPGTLSLEHSSDCDPSKVGLGMVPATPAVKAFSCGVILRQASISLTHLRHLSVPGRPEVSALIADALAWMGLYGILRATGDGFFRSGCDLVTGAENSSLALIGHDASVVEWEVSLEEAAAGFRRAYEKIPDDLHFAEPIEAEYPEVIIRARAETLVSESTSSGEKGKDGKKAGK